MPLPSITVEMDEDPTRFSDLQTITGRPACPYCGSLVSSHQASELDPEHAHTEMDNREICRRLYTCGVNGSEFYVYSYLENPQTLAIAKVVQGALEKTDDSEVITLGRKKINSLLPKWRFKSKLATKQDFTETFAKNLVVGLELELDFRDENHPVSDSVLHRAFGVGVSDYHHYGPCPQCGSSGCWNHTPDNFIRAISRDSSINGWEFILYGGMESSETFARKLPIAKLAEYFRPTWRDSLHVHAMLLHGFPPIPNVIGKNVWQLFRFYYPAWVYLFGNNKREQGFLRTQPPERDYVAFKFFNKTPFSPRWTQEVRGADHLHGGAGLYMRGVPVEQEEMTEFDAEIRTSDSSLDLEQILGMRAITRALMLRAAQLSNFGLISVETEDGRWEGIKTVIAKLNARSNITVEDEKFMRDQAIDFVRELSPFLSPFERTILKHLIESPVRTRSESQQVKLIVPELSDTAQHLKKLISLASIEALDRDRWIEKVAGLMDCNVEKVVNGLREIKSYYDSDLKTFVLVE